MVSLLTRRNRRTPIGIDIGAGGVRAIQMVRSSDRYTVATVAATEWQSNGADRDRELSGRIRRCLRQGDFSGRNTTAGLEPPAVEFHALELPPAVLAGEDANAVQVVRWEVGRLTTQSSDAIETRHWVLPPTKIPAPNAIGVVARRDVIEARLKSCTRAGLVCMSVDVGAVALARFGAALRTWSGEEVWGVLDIGYGEARLVMCVGDIPVLVRRAGPGGHTWTECIAESLQLSAKAAEIQKCEHGIALVGRGVRVASGDAPRSEVSGILFSALRSELKYLASEVKRSYEYVLSCYPGRQVSDLVLVGGGATMQGLPEFMSDSLGIGVRRASDCLSDTGCRLLYEPADDVHPLEVLAQATGLAMGV